MKLTQETVRQIAELAKLELTDEEITMYTEQLSDILGYFEKLQEVDTSHVGATASVLPITNVLREDTPGEPLSPEEVVANAADAVDNQFRVSAVLGDE